MQAIGSELILSATDLSNFLSCRHLTALSMAVAHGKRKRPPKRDDPLLDLLIQRGNEHEKAYVDDFAKDGKCVVDLGHLGRTVDARVGPTLDAMRQGADVIVQGALRDGRWLGYPDVLKRVEPESDFGAWSYEVHDTKLTSDTRAGTILQLALYSELLGVSQGKRPEYFRVITPDADEPEQSFRFDDYAAYFRMVRRQLEATVALEHEVVAEANYPEPVDHCDVCSWWSECNARRRADDHLSLVAGITRRQRRELTDREYPTLTALAGMPLPTPFRPKRGSKESYDRAREQARMQLESRDRTPPLHILRDIEKDAGLCRLPEPSPGDVFLDLEGDQHAAVGGREYLFGLVYAGKDGGPEYRDWWAFDERAERQAFEEVMDLVVSRLAADPGMHVYHYAPYEPSAFKRLAGRYATREDALDRLLREKRFVDLYAVVKQGLVAGVESYSIKKLEPLYAFTRDVDLRVASEHLIRMEVELQLGKAHEVPDEVREAVKGYNRDDCVSTLRLRDWLERVRAEAIANGTTIPRPSVETDEKSATLTERDLAVRALRERLLAGLPDVSSELAGEGKARWILAYLLDWHRREDKARWWEYFKLRDMPDDELLDEAQAIAGLKPAEVIEVVRNKKTKRPTGSVVQRYSFPPQEMEIGRGAELKVKDGPFGEVVAIDRVAHTVDVRKGPKRANEHPSAVFAHKHVSSGVIEKSLFRFGEAVAAAGSLDAMPPSAERDLLMGNPPQLRSGEFVPGASEDATAFAVRLATQLDRTVLAIQGPPGSGKTYTGAHMICELVKRGKKVGITANSHKVIRNLLDAVAKEAARLGVAVRLAHKDAESEDDDDEEGGASGAADVRPVANNAEARSLLDLREVDAVGGTAWVWADDALTGAVDVLFVDEAGQMSLANVLAVSQAAGSVVLLGDPQQLEQPRKGTHPDGVGVSALQHILGEHQTIPDDRGIFLPVTRRLAPSICRFTSEQFYEGKLKALDGLERQVLTGADEFDGSGLYLAEVEHDGNRSSSVEEVEKVAELVSRLTAGRVRWVNAKGEAKQMTAEDVLVISPYNAQVSRLQERLSGTGVKVGTVDKFQGQEAPVVIYSMATSRPEDAPRGMEFLYSPNRLNVATSRARCAAIVVASPRLFEPECRTPRQIKLANGICRFHEMADQVGDRLLPHWLGSGSGVRS